MSKRVTNLRPGVYAGPLAFSGCKGITLDHINSLRPAIRRAERAMERTDPGFAVFDRWDQLKAVRDAVFDVASDTGFNPANHDLRPDHARAVFDLMNNEAKLIRAATAKGRVRSLKTFEQLFEVHDFVCCIIEHSMEPCL